MKHFIVLLFLLFSLDLSAQLNVDSLRNVVENSKDDSLKAYAIMPLSFHYIFNDAEEAIRLINLGLQLAEQRNLPYCKVSLLNTKGIYYDVLAEKDSALYYFQEALNVNKKYQYSDVEVRILNNLGMYNWTHGKNAEALSYFFKALEINHKQPKEKQISDISMLSNIGLIYQEQDLFDKALEYHQKALTLRLADPKHEKSLPISYNNIGICYRSLNRLEDAIVMLKKGIEVAKKYEDEKSIGKIYNSLANVYTVQGKYKEALELHLARLSRAKKISLSPIEAIVCYSEIANCYIQLKKYNQALEYTEKALQLLKEHPEAEEHATSVFTYRANLYYIFNQPDKGLEWNLKAEEVAQKKYNEEFAQKYSELEVKYETEKKEAEYQLLKEQHALKEAEVVSKNRAIYILIVVSLLVAVLMFAWVTRVRLRKKQSELQVLKQFQLEKERISRDLHDNVGGQLSFVIHLLDEIADDNKTKRIELSETLRKSILGIIGNLRETIWATNHESVTATGLSDRLKVFARSLFKYTNVKVVIRENLSNDKTLNAIVGLNLFRICQEILNNAFKYANASEIIITLNEQDNRLIISIADNGAGFDVEKDSNESYGLQNIRKRAAESDAILEVESEIGKGTKYTLIV